MTSAASLVELEKCIHHDAAPVVRDAYCVGEPSDRPQSEAAVSSVAAWSKISEEIDRRGDGWPSIVGGPDRFQRGDEVQQSRRLTRLSPDRQYAASVFDGEP